MKKYQILINNVERIKEYVKPGKEIRKLKINSIFANKKLKELAKKVPKEFDEKSIKKFEKETGLNIKYYVFENKYTYNEYSHYGMFPDANLKNFGKSLEHADILVIDKETNYKKKRNK